MAILKGAKLLTRTREYTADTLPDPATLGVGETVVVAPTAGLQTTLSSVTLESVNGKWCKKGRSNNKSLALYGDSMMGNVQGNFTPTAVSYNSETGVLTCTLTAHGHFTGEDVRVACTGNPQWQARNIQLIRLTADTFSVQLPAGLSDTTPSAGNFRIYLPQYAEAQPFTWLKSGYPNLINHGVNGETTAQIAARLEQVLFEDTDVVWVRMGTNDAAGDAEGATACLGTIEDCVSKLIQFGKTVLISTIPPIGTTAVGGRFALTINAGVRALANKYGLFLVDEWKICADPTSAIGAAKAGYLQADNTHFTSLSSRMIAENELQPIITKLFGPAARLAPVSALDGYDVTNNPTSPNVLSNVTLQTATGGTNGSSSTITGAIAAGITAYATGGFGAGSVTASVAAASDGYGNAQILSATPTAAADMLRITTRAQEAVAAGLVVAGKKYKAACKVRTTGISASNKMRSLTMTVSVTTPEGAFNRIISHSWTGTASAQYLQSNIDDVFESMAFTAPVGLTSIYIDVQLKADAAGASAVTLEVSAPVIAPLV